MHVIALFCLSSLTRSIGMSKHSQRVIVLSPYGRRDYFDSIDTCKKCDISVAQVIVLRREKVLTLGRGVAGNMILTTDS